MGYSDALDRFENCALIVPVGFAQREVERIAVGVNDEVAFDPAQTVFSRIAFLGLAPFLTSPRWHHGTHS